MPEAFTKTAVGQNRAPKDVRPVEIDDVDRRILTALHADARMSNSALAELVGIAPSTCHGRVRRLQELGVIRGFYADIDPAAFRKRMSLSGRGAATIVLTRVAGRHAALLVERE